MKNLLLILILGLYSLADFNCDEVDTNPATNTDTNNVNYTTKRKILCSKKWILIKSIEYKWRGTSRPIQIDTIIHDKTDYCTYEFREDSTFNYECYNNKKNYPKVEKWTEWNGKWHLNNNADKLYEYHKDDESITNPEEQVKPSRIILLSVDTMELGFGGSNGPVHCTYISVIEDLFKPQNK